MLKGSQVRDAFAKIGVMPTEQKRQRKPKGITCRKCGEKMEQKRDENFALCPKCGNYFIFDRK